MGAAPCKFRLEAVDESGAGIASFDFSAISGGIMPARIVLSVERGDKRGSMSLGVTEGPDGDVRFDVDADDALFAVDEFRVSSSKFGVETGEAGIISAVSTVSASRALTLKSDALWDAWADKMTAAANRLTLGAATLLTIKATRAKITAIKSLLIRAPVVNIHGRVNLGGTGGRQAARIGDRVTGFTSDGAAVTAQITTGSPLVRIS